MLKIAAVVSLMLIAWPQADSRRHKKDATPSGGYEPGSTIWAAGISCQSCGQECVAACGTRYFRACCFNYLKKKRTSGATFDNKNLESENDESRFGEQQKLVKKIPIFAIEDVPENWMNNMSPNELDTYSLEGVEHRFPIPYQF